MEGSEDGYQKFPVDGIAGTVSQLDVSRRWFKACCALLSVSCLAILATPVASVLTLTPKPTGLWWMPPPLPYSFNPAAVSGFSTQQQPSASQTPGTGIQTNRRNPSVVTKAMGTGTIKVDDMARDIIGMESGLEPLLAMFQPPRPPANTIRQIKTEVPLGVEFKMTDDGKIAVAEVFEAGNAYKAGLRKGDILRGTTCAVAEGAQADSMRTDLTYWLGEVENSSKKRVLFRVDGASLATVWAEIASNTEIDSTVILIIERIELVKEDPIQEGKAPI
jgi:hypothetical protein